MREINTQDKRFVNGNGRDVLGTVVTAEWLNAVQDEITGVITGFGGTVNPDVPNQLYRLLNNKFNTGVALSGDQTVSGVKTWSQAQKFDAGLQIGGNGNRYALIERSGAAWRWHNPVSNKSVWLSDDGDLSYGAGKIYHEGNKPSWGDVQGKPDVALMNKDNAGAFTVGGLVKTNYGADWVGMVANNTTADKSVFYDGWVNGVNKGGLQVRANGTDGEYAVSLQVTPAGNKSADRRVEGLGVYASGLYAKAYGWLHEYFAKPADLTSRIDALRNEFNGKFGHANYPSHYQGAEVWRMPNGLKITIMRVDVGGSDNTVALPEAYNGLALAVGADVGNGVRPLSLAVTNNNSVRIITGVSSVSLQMIVIGWANH